MLLAFDTATPQVTAALLEEGEVIAELVSERAMKHGEQLAPLIDAVMGRAGVSRRELSAIAVGAGPGPFTGLRVGLVTARTLGLALDVPVYAVCSLDVLAVEAAVKGLADRPFVVATDARRKEVYLASYDADGGRLEGPAVARPDDVATDAPVVGEGALLYPDAFPHATGPARPSAGWLGWAVAEERVELLDPEPLYLRRPDAVEHQRAPSRCRERDPAPRGERGTVNVRAATLADVDALAALEAESFPGDEWTAEYLRLAVEGQMPTVRVLVAEADGALVGHAIISIVYEIAELQRIAVAEAARRRGIATRLLDATVGLSTDEHAERLLLEVREHNHPALAFYRRAGFAEIDRRERYYRDGTTAIVLQLELPAVEDR